MKFIFTNQQAREFIAKRIDVEPDEISIGYNSKQDEDLEFLATMSNRPLKNQNAVKIGMWEEYKAASGYVNMTFKEFEFLLENISAAIIFCKKHNRLPNISSNFRSRDWYYIFV